MSERTDIRLHADDNVVVAVQRLESGTALSVAAGTVTCRQVIPPGHKVATCLIAEGEPVWKFGNPIGVATQTIGPGEHVHSHNLIDANQAAAEVAPSATASGSRSIRIEDRRFRGKWKPSDSLGEQFLGFRRHDGCVGTRNYVLIASRVNCAATVCHEIKRRFPRERLAEFPNVDGIAVATHTTGCAMPYGGVSLKSGIGVRGQRRVFRGDRQPGRGCRCGPADRPRRSRCFERNHRNLWS